jgi:hypothetical protein
MASIIADVCLPVLLLALFPQPANGHHNKLDFAGIGNMHLNVTSNDSHFQNASSGYGHLMFVYARGNSRDAVSTFMGGFDPSMYMRSTESRWYHGGKEPSHLSFAAIGDVTLDLNSAKVVCRKLRFGYHDAWWIGSTSCSRVAKPTPKSPDYSQSLVCECDQGVMVKFSQNSGRQLEASISDCTAVRGKIGRWIDVASSPGNQTMELSYGVDRSYEVESVAHWGRSTTISLKLGFEYEGFKGQLKVSHTTSYDFTESHTSTFSMSQKETYTTSLDAGVVWQFQVTVEDDCGTSSVHMKDFQVTSNLVSPPCCLPGYFQDDKDPLGGCKTVDGENYNLCNKSHWEMMLV